MSMQGHFLVASPQLADPSFYRSVVLIASHDNEHAFGLLLNRPGYETVASFWERQTGDSSIHNDRLVRYGGPLDGPLIVIHTGAKYADAEIIPGIFLSSQRDSVVKVLASDRDAQVSIQGYSGWAPGQLDRELEVGGWLTLPTTDEVLFSDPALQWEIATKQISDEILSVGCVRHVPSDPRWN